MLERLNKEIRRRTRVVGIFPNPESYLRLVMVYLIEYSENWSVTKAWRTVESNGPPIVVLAENEIGYSLNYTYFLNFGLCIAIVSILDSTCSCAS
jgi:hypothetical protein